MEFSQFTESFSWELLQGLDGIRLSTNFGGSILSIVTYVFLALGLYTIAKNRGIRNPWLAWIPVANVWLLGCISDQYRYVVKGEACNRRKRMLILKIVEWSIALVAITLLMIGAIWVGVLGAMGTLSESFVLPVILLGMALLLMLPLVVVSIWLTVEIFCAYHDLFCSCVPQQKTLFTVLSIVGSCLGLGLLASVLVFVCRDKEEGMPQRVQE